jgi:hypothetical protein
MEYHIKPRVETVLRGNLTSVAGYGETAERIPRVIPFVLRVNPGDGRVPVG